MQLLVFSQDIIVLTFDKGDGLFGIIELAGFADVTEGNQGGNTSAGDEAGYDGKIFDHGECVLYLFRFQFSVVSLDALLNFQSFCFDQLDFSSLFIKACCS